MNEEVCYWCKTKIDEGVSTRSGWANYIYGLTFHDECLCAVQSNWTLLSEQNAREFCHIVPYSVFFGPKIGKRGAAELAKPKRRPPGSTLFGIAPLPLNCEFEPNDS